MALFTDLFIYKIECYAQALMMPLLFKDFVRCSYIDETNCLLSFNGENKFIVISTSMADMIRI